MQTGPSTDPADPSVATPADADPPARRRHPHPAARVIAHTHFRPGRLRRVIAVIHWRSLARLVHWRTLSFRRRLAAALVILFAVGAAAVLLGWTLARARPGWWSAVAPPGAAQRTAEVAVAVENGLTTLLNDKRPGGTAEQRAAPWSMTLDAESANAWLSERLPRWSVSQGYARRWPERLADLRLDFRDGVIHVAARLVSGGSEQFVSAALSAAFDRDGSLWLTADSAALGRLPVPVAWALRAAAAELDAPADSEAARLLAALRAERPLLRDASLRLPDGRRVRILALRADGHRLEITCTTEEPAPARR